MVLSRATLSRCPLSATSCSSNIIKHVLTQVHHVLFSKPGQQTLKGWKGSWRPWLVCTWGSYLVAEAKVLTGTAPSSFWPMGLLKSRDSEGHDAALLVFMWRRVCLVRWSLRMKRRSHTLHTNFFSPVCVRRWRESSSERANFLSQPSQWQLNGFSPKREMRIWSVKSRANHLWM